VSKNTNNKKKLDFSKVPIHPPQLQRDNTSAWNLFLLSIVRKTVVAGTKNVVKTIGWYDNDEKQPQQLQKEVTT
jgi:hypothetical protein